ncbi:cilia- and flagella-associated protein 97-like [Anthonomus grandis grandis]|uniref:cilia- and flagella-associated protein 97-like n=1 Tax=Anthonomus grandis grandis TaxID=2921223 RepID=UPI0021669745|nr:cilia- and flagella-associated protein 97-like [Anthonomus grandis grandis]
MSTENLNNCKTCEIIKNGSIGDNSSNYSSDYEDSSAKTDSLDKDLNLESLKLDFSEGKSLKSENNSRRIPVVRNKTFSSEKIREIERGNAMLVDKILYHTRRPNQYVQTKAAAPKVTSSEINRRRRQDKINRENQILLKKIQTVKPAVRY